MADEYVSIELHREFAARIEDENKRQNKRIELLEESMKQIYTLNTYVQKIAAAMESLTKAVGQQNERLEAIEKKPAQNWDKLLWALGGVLISAIAAFVIKQIGLE